MQMSLKKGNFSVFQASPASAVPQNNPDAKEACFGWYNLYPSTHLALL